MQDELILFRKMQEGDWCAFNSFFESYSERLYLYALGFVGNRAEAEDIVQDTFIYLWVNRAKITHSGSLYAYLSRSVKNSCIDRKASRRGGAAIPTRNDGFRGGIKRGFRES